MSKTLVPMAVIFLLIGIVLLYLVKSRAEFKHFQKKRKRLYNYSEKPGKDEDE